MKNEGFIKEIKTADLSVCADADTFLQSSMWGEFKSRFGWKPNAFLIKWEGGEEKPLLAISRKIAPGFSFVYVPWGPELPNDFPSDKKHFALCELAVKLKKYLLKKTVFIRFDPPWYDENSAMFSGDEAQTFLFTGLKRPAADIQPPDTVLVDISLPAEKILENMKPKWRYNISLAEKKGVIVKACGAEDLETFYSLLKETSKRDGILIHGIDYYKTLFELCETEKDEKLNLYIASHEEQAIAAIAVLFRKDCATYLYGASSDKKRNLMPSYALQWKAMQDAKEAGCKIYDLFGIPPDDNPNHPMAGLYRFKTGFGGQVVHRPGSWDYPYKTFFYSLFNLAEKARKKMRDRKKR